MGKPQKYTGTILVVVMAALAVASPGLGDQLGPQIGVPLIQTATNGNPSGPEQVRYGADLDQLASYEVRHGNLLGTPAESHRALWARVLDLVPRGLIDDHVVQLNVTTDGVNRTLAMVHRSGRHRDGWILTIDSADIADIDMLTKTLVHELAHVITLGRDDVEFGVEGNDCDALALSLGCVRAESTIGRFAQRFWAETDEPADYSSSTYLTTYAATSVHEDLAETFMVWVLGDSDDVRSPQAHDKFSFFESEPELVAARSDIRTQLGR